MDKLDCKLDELAKLYCKFDKLNNLDCKLDEVDKLDCKFVRIVAFSISSHNKIESAVFFYTYGLVLLGGVRVVAL